MYSKVALLALLVRSIEFANNLIVHWPYQGRRPFAGGHRFRPSKLVKGKQFPTYLRDNFNITPGHADGRCVQ